MRSEAVISSRIEGIHASLADVYVFETAQLSFFERAGDTLSYLLSDHLGSLSEVVTGTSVSAVRLYAISFTWVSGCSRSTSSTRHSAVPSVSATAAPVAADQRSASSHESPSERR